MRPATHAENGKNVQRHADNKSGFKGVSWCREKKPWQAHIMADGKAKFLGHFSTKEEAYVAYCAAARAVHGEFANLG